MSDPEPKPENQPHPLERVSGLPEAWVATLQSRWITTAEEVLALAASAEGRNGLEATLPPDSKGVDALLEILAGAVGPEKAAQLRQSAAAGGPLGAKLTEEQQKRFGTK